MTRSERKIDHIRHTLSHDRERHNHFDDVDLVHQSLASMDFRKLELNTEVGELSLSSPLFINAMTGGGGKKTEQINGDIAMAAAETGIGMAVGSQMSAIKDPNERSSYEVVRDRNPHGVILANVGSEATVEQAKEAVRMIDGDGLQIHLNTLQELIMPEGDRDFTHRTRNIQAIVSQMNVPVIVKEVGYGMSKETVDRLYSLGVRYIDIGGRGGTNFSKVENMRREKSFSSFNNWGIPTPISLLEATSAYNDLNLIASGGIRHGVDGVKAMVLGGQAFGMAGELLRVLVNSGRAQLVEDIHHLHEEVKMGMMLLNVAELHELKDQSFILYGKTKDWYDQRVTHKNPL